MDQERFPGRLIAVEGLDGSGKSTQIYLLYKWLWARGYRVFFTEWNSSDLVKEVTRKGKKQQLLTPTTFSLIHATDFADRSERQILPMLKAGYLVLADRYFYTSFARDAVRGCDLGWLHSLYGFARRPDIVFYYDIPLEVALGRILEGRPKLKYFEAGLDMGLSADPYESFRIFQSKVQEQYRQMIDACGFTVIDGLKEIYEKQQEMRAIVSRQIDLARFHKRHTR